ncbi:MAG: recombinase family protein [Clostridia bacterium]
MPETLAGWEPFGVGFLSAPEGFDTATALGRLLLNPLARLAECALELIRERVTAGRERAKTQGTAIGRPKHTVDLAFQAAWAAIRPQIVSGRLSQRAAVARLGCGASTVRRLLRTTQPIGEAHA